MMNSFSYIKAIVVTSSNLIPIVNSKFITYLKHLWFCLVPIFLSVNTFCQHSISREWNEIVLFAIRNDYARPTIHARNLFHSSVLMYDSWAIFDKIERPFFLGTSNLGDYEIPFDGISSLKNIIESRKITMNYAMKDLLKHRFKSSPKFEKIESRIDSLFLKLGYDLTYFSTDYTKGDPATLGNYLAEKMIEFGLQDGSNEINEYKNQY